jgi:hypothetical protein
MNKFKHLISIDQFLQNKIILTTIWQLSITNNVRKSYLSVF